jgi:hypothetical protein
MPSEGITMPSKDLHQAILVNQTTHETWVFIAETFAEALEQGNQMAGTERKRGVVQLDIALVTEMNSELPAYVIGKWNKLSPLSA